MLVVPARKGWVDRPGKGAGEVVWIKYAQKVPERIVVADCYGQGSKHCLCLRIISILALYCMLSYLNNGTYD